MITSLSNLFRKIPSRSLPIYSLILVSAGLVAMPAFGQADTDIFLVDIPPKSAPFGKPLNITQRKGYDNQPSFTPDGTSLLYTAMQDDGQTDIYRYSFSQKTATQLTRTPEGEYSPTITPDRAYFSVIRVEADKTQRLWKFPLTGSGEPTLVLPHVKPVGYHCWLDADWLALFILGTPNSLQLARISTGDTVRIEGSIGRTLLKIPGKDVLTYVHKQAPGHWEIKQLNLKTRQISVITPTLEGSEDFVWTPDGTLLMCHGAILYQYTPASGSAWQQLADFSSLGIKQLTRMAIDPQGKKLALVGQ